MRYLPLAVLLTGSLLALPACTVPVPGSTGRTTTGFSVKARPSPRPEVECRVTGGGFICYWYHLGPEKVTFGFNAKSYSDGTAEGEVELVDHGLGYNFHGSTITGVTCRYIHQGNDVAYVITGELSPQSTGYPGTFELVVRDNGEPGNTGSGKGTDTLAFTVTSGALAGYTRSDYLIGGNIQAHDY